MINYIAVVKGVSGSGKSTRVFLFLDFLKSQGFTLSDFHYINFEGKDKVVGILVEELSLIFIGKMYETNGVKRYQGYDVITSSFGKSQHFSDFLKDISRFYSVIVEGAGVTASNRLRPKFLSEYCGFNDILMQYYNYELTQKEEYNERLLYRSGKYPTRGTMWEKCSGFISDHKNTIKEAGDLPDKNVRYFYNSYTAPVYDFGAKLLAFCELDSLIMKFVNHCQESTYIEDNSFKNFENAKSK